MMVFAREREAVETGICLPLGQRVRDFARPAKSSASTNARKDTASDAATGDVWVETYWYKASREKAAAARARREATTMNASAHPRRITDLLSIRPSASKI